MLKFKPIINKRGYIDDLLSLVSTILLILIIFGVSLSIAVTMNGSKNLLSINPAPELKMDKDSPVINMKNILADQIETQLKTKANLAEKK